MCGEAATRAEVVARSEEGPREWDGTSGEAESIGRSGRKDAGSAGGRGLPRPAHEGAGAGRGVEDAAGRTCRLCRPGGRQRWTLGGSARIASRNEEMGSGTSTILAGEQRDSSPPRAALMRTTSVCPSTRPSPNGRERSVQLWPGKRTIQQRRPPAKSAGSSSTSPMYGLNGASVGASAGRGGRTTPRAREEDA